MARLVKTTYRESYQSQGFLLVTDPPFSADLVRRASDGMDMIRRGEYDTGTPPPKSPWNPGDDENTLCKIEMPQFASMAIREIVSHTGLGEIAAEITGAKMVQVWWTQLLYKPPAQSETTNTVIGWHQEEGSQLFTAWIALSDVTPDSGPMRLIRGSHKWGLSESSDFYGQDNAALKANFSVPEGEDWDAVAALLPPGGVSFHDNYTIHGSEINLSDRPRRSLAVHMRTEKSKPVEEWAGEGLTSHLDNQDYNPVIYGERTSFLA